MLDLLESEVRSQKSEVEECNDEPERSGVRRSQIPQSGIGSKRSGRQLSEIGLRSSVSGLISHKF